MNESEVLSVYLREPKLAAHATSALPVWLWSADGTQILFANPVAAALFGAGTSGAIAGRQFEASGDEATQIARLAAGLPPDGKIRLQHLHGFGAPPGQELICACARLTIGSKDAILVAATEPAGPDLPLAERARRLFADGDDAIAVFAPDGALIHATPKGQTQLAGKTKLSELGYGVVTDRLGDGPSTLLVARLLEFPQTIGLPVPPEPEPESEFDLAPIAQAMQAASVQVQPTAGDAVEQKPHDATGDAVPPAITAAEPQIADGEPAEPAAAPATSAAVETSQKDDESDAAPSPMATPQPPERRHPLRFVWEMDADGKFSIGSDEFIDVMGPNVAAALGRPWSEIAADLALDPQGQVARAVASRDTWSGITLDWPVEGSDDRLGVELAGLPAYDRDRRFRGYRGFGVCRDVARINALLARRSGKMPDTPQETEPGTARPEKAETRPLLSVVRAVENVVPFRAVGGDAKPATLSPVERTAFRELATTLTARLKGADQLARGQIESDFEEEPAAGTPVSDHGPAKIAASNESGIPAGQRAPLRDTLKEDRPILDRLPSGILIYRHDHFIYANRAFLQWTGYETLSDFSQAGGLDTLFIEPAERAAGSGAQDQALRIAAPDGGKEPLEARLATIPWDGTTAMALVLLDPGRAAAAPATSTGDEIGELKSILNAATDGVIVLDAQGRILSCNDRADELFGYRKNELTGRTFDDLFAPESERIARRYFELLAGGGVGRGDEGRDVIGRRAKGGLVPLVVTMARISDEPPKFCAVFRDMTHWKRSEDELINARRLAEKASSAKSEFLAKVSHEMRTPLNAIIGFSEMMMGERFGPVGNERYKEYLKDIHDSGAHLVSLLNDLLDLSKIEAGKLDLNFERVDLNELTQASVATMQPQASRARIIIRSSLSQAHPRVMADARSVKQIVLNLLSNSIKFTGAGGQVIISTGLSDSGDAVLRVRDTGIGMSEKDIQIALEPFRQLATTARTGSSGTGLGLPLTKALTEANRARFSIRSAVNAGTLVEIAFPATRVAAE